MAGRIAVAIAGEDLPRPGDEVSDALALWLVRGPEFEILRPVVVLQPVAVMHLLMREQWAAEHLAHDQDVLEHVTVLPGIGMAGRCLHVHIALSVVPGQSESGTDGPQCLAALELALVTGAETAPGMPTVAAREFTGRFRDPDRDQVLAPGKLIEVAGTETPGPIWAPAAVEGAGAMVAVSSPEHEFEPSRRICRRTVLGSRMWTTANLQVKGPVLCSASPLAPSSPIRFCQVVPACPTLASWSLTTIRSSSSCSRSIWNWRGTRSRSPRMARRRSCCSTGSIRTWCCSIS